MDKQKSKWVKMSSLDKETVFFPLEFEGKESFKIWDNANKKFYSEGWKLQTSQGEIEVNKFIALKKLSQEEQNRYRRCLQFVRKVIIKRSGETDNEEVFFAWPTTAENSLLQVMETIRGMKKNPLHFTYKLFREKGENIVKYSVHLGEEIPAEKIKEMLKLSTKEDALIKKMKETEGIETQTTEKKQMIIMENDVPQDRAKFLVNIFF